MDLIDENYLSYLHVSHVVAEQVVQAAEEELRRFPSPPIPKEEKIFCISLLPHEAQETLFSFPIETRLSKCFSHFLQINSYIGIRLLFYIILYPRTIVVVFRGYLYIKKVGLMNQTPTNKPLQTCPYSRQRWA
jgi:hypothetical protein